MPETEKAPSKEAMEAARLLCLALGLQGDPHFEDDQRKAAAALDAFRGVTARDAAFLLTAARRENDALRERNRALDRVEALAAKWEFQQATYPTPDGNLAAAAVRMCAKELRAALAADAKAGEDR